MDDSAPVTWLIGRIDLIVSAGAISTATAIAHTITPMAASCFGVYIILMAVHQMRGARSEPVRDIGLRITGFCVVVGLGLNMANYTSFVIPIVTGLGSDFASAVSRGNVSAGVMDQLELHYLGILDDGSRSASQQSGPSGVGAMAICGLNAAFVACGRIPFLVLAALLPIVADVDSVIGTSVGPLLFAALIFPATRQYFPAWVTTAISYALMPMLVSVIAVISETLSKEMLSDANGSFANASLASVSFTSLRNLVLMLLLRQVSSIDSSLSAGGINRVAPEALVGWPPTSVTAWAGPFGSLGSRGRSNGKGEKNDRDG
jgi:type IV secretion system protein VirB6